MITLPSSFTRQGRWWVGSGTSAPLAGNAMFRGISVVVFDFGGEKRGEGCVARDFSGEQVFGLGFHVT